MDKYNQIVPAQIPFREATRDTPQGTVAALGVTIGMSLGAGLVFTLATGLICWGFDKPFRIALVVGGVVMFAVAIYWFMRGGESLMWSSERILGDLNGDGFIGQPPPPQHFVVEAQAGDGSNSWTLADLPGDQRVIAEWIQDACKRKSLAVELWEPRFGYTTSKYGTKVATYSVFKKVLNDREWLIDRGSHGVILSNEGKRILGGVLPQLQQVEQLALTEGGDDERE